MQAPPLPPQHIVTPKACLQPKDYKISSGKASAHDTLEVSLFLRLSQAEISSTQKCVGLIFAYLHLRCSPESHATRATDEVSVLDQTGMYSQET